MEVTDSLSGLFSSKKKFPVSTAQDCGGVDPRASLDVFTKRKLLTSVEDRTPLVQLLYNPFTANCDISALPTASNSHPSNIAEMCSIYFASVINLILKEVTNSYFVIIK
jgi:hypothetical protein